MSTVTAREMVEFLHGQGLTEQQIADETGSTQPTIHRIRTGTHAEPKHSTWTRIQEAYLKRQADIANAARHLEGKADAA